MPRKRTSPPGSHDGLGGVPDSAAATIAKCDHCGLPCDEQDIVVEGRHFCCAGCRAVYDLLHENDLCAYYDIEATPGSSMKDADDVRSELKWGFLDHADVRSALIEFEDGGIAKATFSIPQMHCASCIYLLENLHRLHDGVVQARVTFLKKTATITWRTDALTLRGVVELLARIGYEPRIRLEDLSSRERGQSTKRVIMQLGVAGFAFGNIMLLSFPDYLATKGDVEINLRYVFGLLSLVLAIPVVAFSARDYFSRAWKGLSARTVNLDVPISLGILVLLLRSSYEVISGVGAGYFDSLAGLVFLLLIGRVFQEKTYAAMSFERDYSSYFPLAVTRLSRPEAGITPQRSAEESVPVTALAPGDRILIRSGELIPADSVLFEGHGAIDYSFVTGESDPVPKTVGDVIYAGGRQTGGLIELEVIEEVSRSYLVRLWNQDAARSTGGSRFASYAERVSGWFTAAVLAIATIAALFWLPAGLGKAVQVFTAVLIVACPCALALATPFTLGTATRLLGRANLFLKRADVVELLARVNHIVFDKTGTLTPAGGGDAAWDGDSLDDREVAWVRALSRQSTHPLSVKIATSLAADTVPLDVVEEHPGRGLAAEVDGHRIRLGSRDWLGITVATEANTPSRVRQSEGLQASEPDVRNKDLPTAPNDGTSSVMNAIGDAAGLTHEAWLEIDGRVRGRYTVRNRFRSGIEPLLKRLASGASPPKLSLLSGDTDRERPALEGLFPEGSDLSFRQAPAAKRDRIHEIRRSGETVMMVGDGLNDAGALDAADVGVVVSEDVTGFSPACDALLDDAALPRLDRMIGFTRQSLRVIVAAFVISFAYNVVGLGFAVAGLLSPLVSAIVMPASSITVVLFTTGMVHLLARRAGIAGRAGT